MIKTAIFLMILSLALLGCDSVYEKQGDKHLAESDGLSALQRYQIVLKKNKGSSEFPAKLTKAYILGMKQTSDSLGDPEIILTYREKILELFPRISDKQLENLYVQTIAGVAEKMATVPDPRFRGLSKTFIQDTQTFGAPLEVQGRMAAVTVMLEQREKELKEKMARAIPIQMP